MYVYYICMICMCINKLHLDLYYKPIYPHTLCTHAYTASIYTCIDVYTSVCKYTQMHIHLSIYLSNIWSTVIWCLTILFIFQWHCFYSNWCTGKIKAESFGKSQPNHMLSKWWAGGGYLSGDIHFGMGKAKWNHCSVTKYSLAKVVTLYAIFNQKMAQSLWFSGIHIDIHKALYSLYAGLNLSILDTL